MLSVSLHSAARVYYVHHHLGFLIVMVMSALRRIQILRRCKSVKKFLRSIHPDALWPVVNGTPLLLLLLPIRSTDDDRGRYNSLSYFGRTLRSILDSSIRAEKN